MKKYISFFTCAIQSSMMYRWNFFINIIAKFTSTFVMFYIWKIIFKSNKYINGYTWETMQLYIFVSFICSATVSWNTETGMSRKIIDGSIAADLIKPVNIKAMTFFQALGDGFIPNIFSISIVVLFALFQHEISISINVKSGFFFFLSLLLSFLLNFMLVYIFSLFCFWTNNAYGIITARLAILNFFSGLLIPLDMLPKMLFNFSLYLPFKGIIHIPASIFIGKLDGDALVWALVSQLLWLVCLWIFSIALYKKAIKYLTINGG